MRWASPFLIYPSSLLYPSIPSHFIPIHIHSLLYLFISSLFYTYSYRRLSFLYSPSHSTSHFHSFSSQHTLSSLFFYAIPFLFCNPYFSPSSLIILLHFHSSSHSLSLSFHHLLIILPIHSFTHHPLSPILFSFHPSSYSISTPLSFPLLPLSSTNHSRIRFSPSIVLFVPRLLSIIILLIHLYSILFFLIYSRNIYSIHSLLSYPFTHILLSSRLLYSAEELHSNKSKGQLLVQRELGLYLPNCELCITPAPSIWILFLFRLYSVWHSLPSIHSSWPFLLSFWTSPFID